ncbi:hypothetical protein LOAG_14196 [Loa loa]|uniref:Uncharacterized protein n=1 Tax=Loa loa TaxID=7209 RepID=A0A1S0TI49_LOALO|nr:hypothetical protein LOAG_14196 [Loa loa]EFO14327.1 hypothetical protein LOAG_14196 [Loa loa]
MSPSQIGLCVIRLWNIVNQIKRLFKRKKIFEEKLLKHFQLFTTDNNSWTECLLRLAWAFHNHISTFTSIAVDVRCHKNSLIGLQNMGKAFEFSAVKKGRGRKQLLQKCHFTSFRIFGIGRTVKRLCVIRPTDSPQKYNDYFEFPIGPDMMLFTVHGLVQTEGIFDTVEVNDKADEFRRRSRHHFIQ